MTATGYTEAKKNYGRFYGLLEAIKAAVTMQHPNNPELIILGGESNFLFQLDTSSENLLIYVEKSKWLLPEMQ